MLLLSDNRKVKAYSNVRFKYYTFALRLIRVSVFWGGRARLHNKNSSNWKHISCTELYDYIMTNNNHVPTRVPFVVIIVSGGLRYLVFTVGIGSKWSYSFITEFACIKSVIQLLILRRRRYIEEYNIILRVNCEISSANHAIIFVTCNTTAIFQCSFFWRMFIRNNQKFPDNNLHRKQPVICFLGRRELIRIRQFHVAHKQLSTWRQYMTNIWTIFLTVIQCLTYITKEL